MDTGILGDVGDFLGGVGVLITLLYLAVQIRQNTAATRIQTVQQILNSSFLANIHHAASGRVPHVLQKVEAGARLDEEETGVYVFFAQGILSQQWQVFYQHQNGTGEQFNTGAGFDVNPVVWKTLAVKGVCLRGPRIDDLHIQPDSEALRQWNLRNLESYWRPWAEQILRSPDIGTRLRHRWWTSWGVLGAPRLHHTINTGEVISKESAAEYALSEFDSRWHPIIEEGLAYRTGKPRDPSLGPPRRSLRHAAEFVLHVVDSAHRGAA